MLTDRGCQESLGGKEFIARARGGILGKAQELIRIYQSLKKTMGSDWECLVGGFEVSRVKPVAFGFEGTLWIVPHQSRPGAISESIENF